MEDVLAFRDQVAAIEHYRQISGQAVEACNEAAEMKLRAERKIGELLAAMPKHKGGNPALTTSIVEGVATLDSLGIEYKQSHRWQQVAALPEEVFEDHIRQTREAGADRGGAGQHEAGFAAREPEGGEGRGNNSIN